MAEIKEDEVGEALSCDSKKYKDQLCKYERIAVIFAGKDFPASENFIDAVAKAQEEGYLGDMEVGIIPVDSKECDSLAEAEKVDVLPTVNVYKNCQKIGQVTPTDKDAKNQYKETISKLINLSED